MTQKEQNAIWAFLAKHNYSGLADYMEALMVESRRHKSAIKQERAWIKFVKNAHKHSHRNQFGAWFFEGRSVATNGKAIILLPIEITGRFQDYSAYMAKNPPILSNDWFDIFRNTSRFPVGTISHSEIKKHLALYRDTKKEMNLRKLDETSKNGGRLTFHADWDEALLLPAGCIGCGRMPKEMEPATVCQISSSLFAKLANIVDIENGELSVHTPMDKPDPFLYWTDNNGSEAIIMGYGNIE